MHGKRPNILISRHPTYLRFMIFTKHSSHTLCITCVIPGLDFWFRIQCHCCKSPHDQRLLIVMKHFTKITMLLLLTIRTTPLHQQMWKSVSVDGVFFFQVFYLDCRIVVHPGRNCSVGWICQCSGQECLLVMDG